MLRIMTTSKFIVPTLLLLLALLTTGCDQIQDLVGNGDQSEASSAEAAAEDSDEQAQPGDGESGVDGQFADRPQADGSPAPTRPNEPRFRTPGDSNDSSERRDNEYNDWRQNQAERRERANERRRRNPGTASIGEEPQRRRIPASVSGELTDRQLRRFGDAVESVGDFEDSEDLEARMAQARNFEDAMRIHQEIEDEMRTRIERSGLSYDEFMGIVTRLQNEPELEQRLGRIIGGPSAREIMNAEVED